MFLHRLGCSLLLVDFQAHGESAGKRITSGYLESRDVAASIAYLHGVFPNDRIGVIGVSLGAAAFVLAAERPKINALVLESMYPTLDLAVNDRLRLYLGRFGPAVAPILLRQLHPRLGFGADQLRPIDTIGLIDAPVLIIHGNLDQRTSLEEAASIYAAAKEPKAFWTVPGAAHVNLHDFATDEYERRVSEFFSQHLQHPVLPCRKSGRAREPPVPRVNQGESGATIKMRELAGAWGLRA